MIKLFTSIFVIIAVFNIVQGLDRRLQTANIDFINVESNNRKQQPQVPKADSKNDPKLIPTTTIKSIPAAHPKEQTKPIVLQMTTSKTVVTTTPPSSKVKQLAKNYDERVSNIGKEVAADKARFNLTRSEFPPLPKSSGTVTNQQNSGTRSWSSVVAGDKQKNPSTKV